LLIKIFIFPDLSHSTIWPKSLNANLGICSSINSHLAKDYLHQRYHNKSGYGKTASTVSTFGTLKLI
jgi:hypothetical protein